MVMLKDVAEQTDAAPAPPAPGYHDSNEFPELDHQRIPNDTNAAEAEQMDRANSPEGHARELASPRPPAQAGGGDQAQQEEPPQGHPREQASQTLSALADEVDEPENNPLGVAREQASPQLPAQAHAEEFSPSWGASPEEEDARTGRAAVRQHVEQMRYQHCNLQRRKATFDKRFGGSNDQVEAFMKDHPSN